MTDWSYYKNALEILEDSQENRFIDLMGPEALLGEFLFKGRAARADTHWIIASQSTYRALREARLKLASELLRFSENNTETLGLARAAISEGAKRLCIGLADTGEGTKFTLLAQLAALSEAHPDTQIVLLRASGEAELPSPAACRILFETEETLFCRTTVERVIKIGGVPVIKRFESHRYSFKRLREETARLTDYGATLPSLHLKADLQKRVAFG